MYERGGQRRVFIVLGDFKGSLTRKKLIGIELSLWDTNFGLVAQDDILKQMLLSKFLVLVSKLCS